MVLWRVAGGNVARSAFVQESPREDPAIERLIRQVETRAEVKEQLKDTARGLLGTALIFGGIVALMALMLAGAIAFATIMTAFQR